MPTVPRDETDEATLQAVSALHEVLLSRGISPEQAVSAAAELLGLVLLNALAEEAEIHHLLDQLNVDLHEYVKTNAPKARASRELGKTSKGLH